MDLRKYHTNNRIIDGLIKCLQEKPFRKLNNQDIIQAAEISPRTFYRYYDDKNDLLDKIEDDLIAKLKESLEEDRQALVNLPEPPNSEAILDLADPAFRKTLQFCVDNREIAKVLLSQNGDIMLEKRVEEVSEAEFLIRAKYLSGNEELELDDPLLVKMYVSQIITLIENWLVYSDEVSPQMIRRFIGEVQVMAPFDMLKLKAKEQKK